MIAWIAGRVASRIAKACGGGNEAQGLASGIVGSLFCVVDPVGATFNIAHSGARAFRDEHTAFKVADNVMGVGGFLLFPHGDPDGIPDSGADAEADDTN